MFSMFTKKKGKDSKEQKSQFSAGEPEIPGGFSFSEPASLNPTSKDMVKRFGGSTCPEMPWPADTEDQGDDEDRFARLEASFGEACSKIQQKLEKRASKSSRGKSRSESESGSGSTRSAGAGME